MENLPNYISVIFILTTLLSIWLFYRATNRSRTVLIVLLAWISLQAVISLSGFYTDTVSMPPHFMLLVLPAMLCILILFITRGGRKFIDSLSLRQLTILHTIRIPVEIVLLWLAMNKTVSLLMTFEGRNFDIISGITAPVVYYWGFVTKKLNRKVILLWNIVCLGLLANIVTIAVMALPYSFQKLDFAQPNIAVMYFPFVWLPCCIVPIVLFSHLAAIRQLVKKSG